MTEKKKWRLDRPANIIQVYGLGLALLFGAAILNLYDFIMLLISALVLLFAFIIEYSRDKISKNWFDGCWITNTVLLLLTIGYAFYIITRSWLGL